MTFKKQLQNLSDAIDELVAERDALRLAVKENQPMPDNESVAARVLKDALINKPGWRDEARRITGLSKMIECEMCGKLFPSGGRRKLTCGDKRCQFGRLR